MRSSRNGPYKTPLISWTDAGRGALTGTGLLLLGGMVFSSFSAEVLETSEFKFGVFLLQLAAFALAGGIAGYAVDDAPVPNGFVAAVGTLLLWIPIRTGIWWIAQQDTGIDLFSASAIATSEVAASFALACLVGPIAAIIGAGFTKN